MMDSLETVLNRIRSNKAIATLDEATIKQGVILRVLNALGWDTFETDEVRPEFPVIGGNVDYALRLDGENKVFVEAKRPSEELSKHQIQLLNYAFADRASLAILTNGLEWWLYLPREDATWEERRFCSIDIRSQDVSVVANSLTKFLSRDKVRSGEATRNAKSHMEFLRSRREIEDTLPIAWQRLLNPPDDLLIELLDEKVKELCGRNAGTGNLKQFLENLSVSNSPSATQPAPPPRPVSRTASPKTAKSTPHIQAAHGSYTGKTLSGFAFQGRSYSGGKWIQMLVALSEQMYQLHRAEFDKVLELKGKKRPYFSRNSEELFKAKPIGRTGFHVESNLSASSIVKISHLLLAKFGYREDDLQIETT